MVFSPHPSRTTKRATTISLTAVAVAATATFFATSPVYAQRQQPQRIGPPPFIGGDDTGHPQGSGVITDADAVRFLEQCTFGPTKADIDHVKQVGYDAYLEEQFAAPASNYLYTVPTPYSLAGMKQRFLTNAVRKPDQLRQRVAFALSQVLVASGGDAVFPGERKASAMMTYQAVLSNYALGNYRDLLYAMTLDPSMGAYLNMVNNAKPNVAANSLPNENYGRELLQLFSLGIYKLNPDGTVQNDGSGNPIPTYGNDEVTQFARVFTGWTYAPASGAAPTAFNYTQNFARPMALYSAQHDIAAKTLLNGLSLPARTTSETLDVYANRELNAAIDNIFNHSNCGPFVATRLIQHLVTANPSPAYVGRVTAVFNNNGQGVRGDMKAVLKAVLLDTEARDASLAANTAGYGHWRSGVLLMTAMLRQLVAQGDLWNLDTWAANMRQDIMSPASVFSFYKPQYTITTSPGVAYSAPETQTFTTESALRRINFLNTLLFSSFGTNAKGTSVTSLDIADYLVASQSSAAALVDLVNTRFLHDTMTTATRTQITNAVNAVSTTDHTKRVRTALYLAAASNEFQVVR